MVCPDLWLPYCWATLNKLCSASVPHSSFNHMEILASSKFNYFMGQCRPLTVLRHEKLLGQYVPYGTFQVNFSCCHYCC